MIEPSFDAGDVTVYLADSLVFLPDLADESVHAVVTDPPYGLSFMGREWDTFGSGGARFEEWVRRWAIECLRLLTPGGYLLAFGGTRTWHRLAAGIEDAGFEVRDSIAWLYGTGFPKNLDVAKAIETTVVPGASAEAKKWDGWGTALKPAFEPIVVARKPFRATVAAAVLAHGTGALNLRANAVGDEEMWRRAAVPGGFAFHPDGSLKEAPNRAGRIDLGKVPGRWPPNVLLDEATAEEVDRQAPGAGAGGRASGPTRTEGTSSPSRENPVGGTAAEAPYYADAGGAGRFFPTFRYEPKAPAHERPSSGEELHPTVKPLDLMRWLVRLVTPPGGVVLDPFLGSGTTLEACLREGFSGIGVEREAGYLPLIVRRLSRDQQPVLLGWEDVDSGSSGVEWEG